MPKSSFDGIGKETLWRINYFFQSSIFRSSVPHQFNQNNEINSKQQKNKKKTNELLNLSCQNNRLKFCEISQFSEIF